MLFTAFRKLHSEGINKFLIDSREFLLNKLYMFAKDNHHLTILPIFILCLTYGEIVIKKKRHYIRYTPFGENLLGSKKYYFIDLNNHDRIDQYWKHKYINKYYSNNNVFIEPSDTVLEIGACRGITTQIAAERAEKVIALEPSPRVFECLKQNIQSNKINILHYAAWKEADEIEINYGISADNDSLIEPDDGQKGRALIQAKTIENIIEEINVEHIDFLKVEAEGTEPEVLKGIGDLDINKIVVNCSKERNGESTLENVSNVLEEKGYEIVDYDGTCLYSKKNIHGTV